MTREDLLKVLSQGLDYQNDLGERPLPLLEFNLKDQLHPFQGEIYLPFIDFPIKDKLIDLLENCDGRYMVWSGSDSLFAYVEPTNKKFLFLDNGKEVYEYPVNSNNLTLYEVKQCKDENSILITCGNDAEKFTTDYSVLGCLCNADSIKAVGISGAIVDYLKDIYNLEVKPYRIPIL